MKSAATSFLGMEGESENQFEENGNNNFNDSGPSGPASYAPGQIPSKVRNDVAFTSAVTAMAKKYNIPEDYLYAVMSFETGGSFSPSQKNMAGSGATGLIQFMPSTARGLGTTTDALAKMSRAEQMVYVDKYFSNKGITGGSLSDVYMAVLFPAAVGKSENFVLFGKGAMKGYTGIAYRQNSGLDINRDGSVTKAEASAKVTKNLPISTPDNSTQISPNSQSSGNSSSITGSSSKSSSPSSVSTYASYENGGDDSNTIVVTLPDRYYQSGSESSSLPILAMDSKSILNSYYKSQLVGFLYKQG
jgi:hypothetical protein